jgi:hypothetical protein
MSRYRTVGFGLLLAVASAATTLLGMVLGIYATMHMGIALHGQYDYFAAGSPVGAALMTGGAALGALLPLGIRALWKKRQAAAR